MKNLKLILVILILAAIGCGASGVKHIKYLAYELSGGQYTYTAQTGPITEIHDISELPPKAAQLLKKTSYFFLGTLLCILLAALTIIAMIIVHISSELNFYHREKRVYGKDISGTGITLTLKVICIVLIALGSAVFLFCLVRLGAELSVQSLSENFTGIVKTGAGAKWLYGAYLGIFMLILAAVSLVSAFLYGAYRRRLNRKTGFAERNVSKEDMSWLLDVDYHDDENNENNS